MNTSVEKFCRQIRERSRENQDSLTILLNNQNYGIAIGLLRQELDSLIRVAYLSDMGMTNSESKRLIDESVSGNQWKKKARSGKDVRITDREMIDLSSKIGGWVNIIYSFGCKLIHLSDFHDYKSTDPFEKMETENKQEVIRYLHRYHQYPYSGIDMNKLVEYLPNVMKKLVDNVSYYVSDIEKKCSEKNTKNT